MTGALAGVKICDFSWVGAGPRATKDLADHGATVVKIESRSRLDLGRLSPPFKDGKSNPDGSAFFAQTNTGKRSVTINLADPRGVAVASRLVAWSDVVVENFSKGYLDRLGLSYTDMQKLRPGIILVSVSVAGRHGPLSAMRGYGNSAAALSGQAALSGWDGAPPHMPPFAYGDVVAPLFAVLGTLAALEHRRKTGQGQHIDISQVEPLMHAMSGAYALASATPGAHPSRDNRDPHKAPHGVFACRGHDQWCAIAVATDAQFAALCEVLGASGLAADPRYATPRGRKAAEVALEEAISSHTRRWDKHALAAALRRAGVPAGAVQDGRDIFTDSALIDAGHYVAVEHPVLGLSAMPAPPARFSRSAIEVTAAPLLGADTDTVLGDWLGMPANDIAALRDAGVLA
jgi:benzylsuccinate CoA-transferase BbsF subunit